MPPDGMPHTQYPSLAASPQPHRSHTLARPPSCAIHLLSGVYPYFWLLRCGLVATYLALFDRYCESQPKLLKKRGGWRPVISESVGMVQFLPFFQELLFIKHFRSIIFAIYSFLKKSVRQRIVSLGDIPFTDGIASLHGSPSRHKQFPVFLA